jgi:O-antigen/teichoic acid export membrane protein
VLAGFEAYRRIAVISLLSGLVSFPLIVLGTLWHGILGTLWALAASTMVNVVLSSFAVSRVSRAEGVTIDYLSWRNEWRILGGFSLPVVLNSAVIWTTYWLCGTILVNSRGGYAEMGVYNAANQWFMLLSFGVEVVNRPLLPVISERFATGHIAEVANWVKSAAWLNVIVIIPVILGLCFLSPVVMSIYGTGFSNAWLVLVVVLLSAVAYAAHLPASHATMAAARMWTVLIISILWAVLFIALTWVWVDHGALGLAIARLVANCLYSGCLIVVAINVIHKKDCSHKGLDSE